MKAEILAFIETVEKLFLNRRKAMPPLLRAHRPHIQALENDEKNLEQAIRTIEQLDESNETLFAQSLMHYLMEKVILVFKNWKKRIKNIGIKTINANIEGHIKARAEYTFAKETIYSFIDQINSLKKNEPLILIGNDVKNPGKEIIQQYNKDNFLKTYAIQTIEEGSLTRETKKRNRDTGSENYESPHIKIQRT